MDEIFRSFIYGDYITMEIGEYDEKTLAVSELDNILNLLFDNATLSYSKDKLNFSDYAIMCYLRSAYPNRYQKKLEALRNDEG